MISCSWSIVDVLFFIWSHTHWAPVACWACVRCVGLIDGPAEKEFVPEPLITETETETEKAVGGESLGLKNKSKQKKKIATSSFSFVVARGSREAPSARLHAKAIASQLKPFLLIQTRKRVS
jgi:hypothetical protein